MKKQCPQMAIAVAGKGKQMNDVISRQAAIDVTWEEPSYSDPLNVLTEVRGRIKALPSAQPEQLSLQKFTEYQIEWLTSHCDIELEPVLEGWIVRFLRDTAECYEAERREDGCLK